MSDPALESVEQALEQGGEPDDVLRAAVRALTKVPGIAGAGIAFLEESGLVLGPSAGDEDESRRVRIAVAFQGAKVGELWVDGDADPAFLERVALLLSAHVLIGWDTRGEAWEP
jgi:hypothetical protein